MQTMDYKDFIRTKKSNDRFTHSVNVADEAVMLAKQYGCDEQLAYIAGILHDVAKEFSKEEQLQIIADGGIILDNVQKNAPKLWHSICGSIYVRDVMGIKDNNIINAVRYHTTGRADMSLLEKIIYTADFTSPERSYDGVETMRTLSRRRLEDAMLFSCKFTLENLSSKELAIHKDQLDCYNELVLHAERSNL